MKIKNINTTILLIIIFSTLTSCNKLEPLQVNKINKFTIDNKNKATLVTTEIELYNPNNVRFIIKSTDVDVFVENTYLGKLILTDAIVAKPKQSFTGGFYIEINLPNMLIAGATVLGKIKKGEFTVHLKGQATGSFMFTEKNIIIDTKQKVNL